jgi:hypothetical protein
LVWQASVLARRVETFSPARTSYATPRVSSRTHIVVVSEALAVVRNGSLTRVGSVASVVATTSSIAIQGVVIPDFTLSRQWVAKIFFRDALWKSIDAMVV